MNKVLLDTDIFSECRKAKNPIIVNRAKIYLSIFGKFTISVITVTEIIKGWHKQGREDRIQQFLGDLNYAEVFSLELQEAQLTGRIVADLERTGQFIGYSDSIIAAIAIHHNITVVTGN